MDAALPRSAPKIFNALADAVEWMVKQFGSTDVWHYLDDFIVCGAEGTEDCASSLQLLKDLCGYLGIPLSEEKGEGPTTRITFLGRHGGRRLPTVQLRELRKHKKRCTENCSMQRR